MNKRHYEHTLPNIRGSLSNTYIGTLFAKFKKMWFVTEFGDVSFNSDV